MLQRVAIFAASLVAAATLALGFAIAGLAPTPVPVAVEPVAATADAPTPAPVVQVDTVYVAPQATPQDVVVTNVVTAAGGGERNENEGSGD